MGSKTANVERVIDKQQVSDVRIHWVDREVDKKSMNKPSRLVVSKSNSIATAIIKARTDCLLEICLSSVLFELQMTMEDI